MKEFFTVAFHPLTLLALLAVWGVSQHFGFDLWLVGVLGLLAFMGCGMALRASATE